MPVSDVLIAANSTQASFTSLSPKRSSLPGSRHWFHLGRLFIKTGLILVGVDIFQQFLIQLYAACWQMALLFALIGLMMALLLGQHFLYQTQSRSLNDWVKVSSIIVTVLAIGFVVCILAIPVTA